MKDDEPPTLSREKCKCWVVDAVSFGHPVHVEAKEWANGEGVDLSLGDNPVLPVHYDEFDAVMTILSAIHTDGRTAPGREA